MNILGINAAFHESSVVLLREGKLVIAVEEERFNRLRHAKKTRINEADNLPINAINACIEESSISVKHIDAIVYSFNPYLRRRFTPQLDVKTNHIPDGDYGTHRGEEYLYNAIKNTPKIIANKFSLSWLYKFHFVPHHLAHAASAVYCAPFPINNEERVAFLTVDGIGEIDTCTWGVGDNKGLKVLKNYIYPHSLGFLWEKITAFLGYQPNNDESKIMMLASYGDPKRYSTALKKIVSISDAFKFTINNKIMLFRTNDFRGLIKLFGPPMVSMPVRIEDQQRQMDIAAALQEITTIFFLTLGKQIAKTTKCKSLALSGGVALNCTAIGQLASKGLFERIWVQPAANDAGAGLGAAVLWNQMHGTKKFLPMEHVYHGTKTSPPEIERSLIQFKKMLTWEIVGNPAIAAAKDIAKGSIIGWFQGKMEFGPRALGNRSILANPSHKDVKYRINMLKKRATFNPCAASILSEDANEWFDIHDCVYLSVKNMNVAVSAKAIAIKKSPAVIHEDKTCRIQVVDKENELFQRLILSFKSITGLPLVLNTSLNLQTPIVRTPNEALDTFMKMDLDVLYIENYRIRKEY